MERIGRILVFFCFIISFPVGLGHIFNTPRQNLRSQYNNNNNRRNIKEERNSSVDVVSGNDKQNNPSSDLSSSSTVFSPSSFTPITSSPSSRPSIGATTILVAVSITIDSFDEDVSEETMKKYIEVVLTTLLNRNVEIIKMYEAVEIDVTSIKAMSDRTSQCQFTASTDLECEGCSTRELLNYEHEFSETIIDLTYEARRDGSFGELLALVQSQGQDRTTAYSKIEKGSYTVQDNDGLVVAEIFGLLFGGFVMAGVVVSLIVLYKRRRNGETGRWNIQQELGSRIYGLFEGESSRVSALTENSQLPVEIIPMDVRSIPMFKYYHQKDRLPQIDAEAQTEKKNNKSRSKPLKIDCDKTQNSCDDDCSSSSNNSEENPVGTYMGMPGDMIYNQYKIICDAGVGTFGRVVECLDMKQVLSKGKKESSVKDGLEEKNELRQKKRRVAVKVIRSVKKYYDSALIEAKILRNLNSKGDDRGKQLCVQLFDQFCLDSGHYCLVFECLGVSLYEYLKSNKYTPFPMYCVRDFAKQLLDVLEFIHSVDLIHTDLKPENILLVSNEVVPFYGSMDHIGGKFSTTKSKRSKKSAIMVPKSTKIKLIDFGGATYDHERKKFPAVNTRQYRTPEEILAIGWSKPSDIWAAGCVIAELHLGEVLFNTCEDSEHLALIECVIGPFPKKMLKSSKRSIIKKSFDASTGLHLREKVLSVANERHVKTTFPLEHLISRRGNTGDVADANSAKWSHKLFLNLLMSLLTIDPKNRATASEALQSLLFKSIDKEDTVYL